ncbi:MULTISPECIES: hypothetical protein [unclassified Rhodococcus (in: high G+C Gram-positive bacteria)]|uniref:hypothetical protein n=1 Tax=unclassified Rhodococcus (in: high G+C Gram-positive bacteria) TaxID=192944 RepID=UPI003395B61B
MSGVCGIAVEPSAVRISYLRDGRRIEDSIDAEGAHWLLNGKLADCGPFDDVVLTGRDSDVVASLLDSLDSSENSTIRMVDEGSAVLAYARSIERLATARALLVLDLGTNGTTALTLDVAAGDVTRSRRTPTLSGDALDGVVEKIVMAKNILPPAEGVEGEREYRVFFRDLKEMLSTAAGVRAPNNGPVLITRNDFDDAAAPLILQALAWAVPSTPDAVLLIGGGSHMPIVRSLVERRWVVDVVVPDSPMSVIAEGAALEAAPIAPTMTLATLLAEHHASTPPAVVPESVVVPESAVVSEPAEAEAATQELRTSDAETAQAAMETAPMQTVPVALAPVLPAPVDAPPEWTVPAGTAQNWAAPNWSGPIKTPPASVPASQSPRRMQWSVRDAAWLGAVATVVLLVWAIVAVRGNTAPPPGIGIDPGSIPAGNSSVTESAPALPEPIPMPESEPVPEPVDTFDPVEPGADPDTGNVEYTEDGFYYEDGYVVENDSDVN